MSVTPFKFRAARPQTAAELVNDRCRWRNLGRKVDRLPLLSGERDRRVCSAIGCFSLAVDEFNEIGLCAIHARQLECVRS